jgi:hypothetical protein
VNYDDWSGLYFPAFYYAYGKTNEDVVRSSRFANWYTLNYNREDPNREISKMYARWLSEN